MAKKQTRRTFSVSRATYDAAVEAAARAGVSASEWVTNLIRAACPELPPQIHGSASRHVQPAPAMDAFREVVRNRIAARAKPIVLSIEEIERRQREHEQQALANPCRREYCRIMGLHAADDPRHGKKIAARGEE